MIEPRRPQRPLVWPGFIFALQDIVMDEQQPVYIVGGAVRDAYRHLPIHDLDLTTASDAIGLARRLADKLDGDLFIMDRERDVARVLVTPANNAKFNTMDAYDMPDQLVIDVARFRGDDLLADLRDRDITFNAMAVDLKSDLTMLIDPLDGESDLQAKIVRRCAPHALYDDPVRPLRVLRMSWQFNARIEKETLADVRALAPDLMQTSAERVRDEFFKLLRQPRPAGGVRIGASLGLIKSIIPEINPLHGLPQPEISDTWTHTLLTIEKLNGILETISPRRSDTSAASFEYGIIVVALDRYRRQLQTHIYSEWPNNRTHWTLLVLTALLHDIGWGASPDGRPVEVISAELAAHRAEAIRLSSSEKQRIAQVIQHHKAPIDLPLDVLSLHRFWRRLEGAGIDVCLLALANYLGTVGHMLQHDTWLKYVERIQIILGAYFDHYETIVAPPTLIDGNQLMDSLNLEPGPQIGQMLDHIREAQVTGDVQTYEDALNTARALLNGAGTSNQP